MRQTIKIILGVTILVLGATAARANNRSDDAALLPIEASGNVPAQDLARVNASLVAQPGSARVISAQERAEVPRRGCGTAGSCWAEIGKALLAHRVIGGTLTSGTKDSFTLSLILVDVGVDVGGAVELTEVRRTLGRDALATEPSRMLVELIAKAPAVNVAGVVVPPSSSATSTLGVEPAASSSSVAAYAPARKRDRLMEPQILLGVRVGTVLPQVFNKLRTNFIVDVELAYQLPFWHRRIGLFADASYSQPTADGTRTDPRVIPNGGVETYHVSVRDLGFALGVQYRHAVGRWVVPYVGVAAKLHLTRTVDEQRAGTVSLGTNTEDSTRVGFLGRLGLGIHLGPGDLVVEGHVEYTKVDHLITGDDNTAHIAIQLGYLIRL